MIELVRLCGNCDQATGPQGHASEPPELRVLKDRQEQASNHRRICDYAGDDLTLTGAAIAGFGFRYASPQRRFYLADAVVGYRCANGRIVRKEFSELSDAAAYDYSDAALLVDSVRSCTFRYQPGNAMRGGLVTIELVLEQAGERISLLQQVHVDNAP